MLSKGFFNAECKPKSISLNNNRIYETYLNSWNYEYDSKNEGEELEELAPGKMVFLIESIEIPVTLENQKKDPDKPEDPFYYIYKNVISQGGEPIYIRNLKKNIKYLKLFMFL